LGAFLVAAVGVTRAPSTPAAAATENRVLEIVQTGPEPDAPVKMQCVRFTEDSISGAEALRRASDLAGWDAQFASYGNMGQSICAICHVGCSSSDCFCDPKKFWAYDRAPAGTTTFRASSVGASSTRLYDGDVEGWRWGEGSAPPYTSVVEACGGPEPVARTSSATTTSTTAASASGTDPGAGGAPPETTAPPAVDPSSPAVTRPPAGGIDPSHLATTTTAPAALAPAADAGATTVPDDAAPSTTLSADETAAAPTPAPRTVHATPASHPWTGRLSWLAYAALLGGLALLWVRARRAARRPH
jgi:hypothetical protein